jgi:RNA polymerase sigma factor (TIGR02999 family)
MSTLPRTQRNHQRLRIVTSLVTLIEANNKRAFKRAVNERGNPMATQNAPVTMLLQRWRAGDEGALSGLIDELYDPLRKIAAQRLRKESGPVDVDPSALLHDAYFKFTAGIDVTWVDRNHFLAIASNIMRQILVDHARKRQAIRRACDTYLTLTDVAAPAPENQVELVALDEALQALKSVDARKAEVIHLHTFGGLTIDEIAQHLTISRATADREFRAARAWLFRALNP